MINNAGTLETINMTVEERLGALIASCNCNNRELQKGINELTEGFDWQGENISSLWDQIGRLGRKKAGKLGLVLMAAAGIAYVIKNEYDKSVMKNKLIQLDKDARGCEQFAYTPQENEGEASEPIN